jgi:hypothetical protein
VDKAGEESVRAARADFLSKVFTAGSAAHVEGSRTTSSWSGAGGETPSLGLSGARNSAALLFGMAGIIKLEKTTKSDQDENAA